LITSLVDIFILSSENRLGNVSEKLNFTLYNK